MKHFIILHVSLSIYKFELYNKQHFLVIEYIVLLIKLNFTFFVSLFWVLVWLFISFIVIIVFPMQ